MKKKENGKRGTENEEGKGEKTGGVESEKEEIRG
jgi:hypothetical protein